MASRDRGRPLLARHAFSCLAAPALSKRDLAWFCVARGKLPLFGGPRLLALSMGGFPRLYVKNHSARSIACRSRSGAFLITAAVTSPATPAASPAKGRRLSKAHRATE